MPVFKVYICKKEWPLIFEENMKFFFVSMVYFSIGDQSGKTEKLEEMHFHRHLRFSTSKTCHIIAIRHADIWKPSLYTASKLSFKLFFHRKVCLLIIFCDKKWLKHYKSKNEQVPIFVSCLFPTGFTNIDSV